MESYKEIARQSRIKCLELIFKAQTSHIGSLMSCADIMAVLFEKIDLNKDKFVLSAGWKACLLYFHLWRKGRITEEELNSYCQPGSKFIGLAEPIIPEIPAAGGSMGFGLPFGVGFALSKKIKKEEGKIYVLMSDGEMDCGTTWESALIAAHHKLDNLVVIVDFNGLQAMGRVKDILNIEPLKDKWQAFGWEVREIDGHNFEEIEKSLTLPPAEKGKPIAIIARTVKGSGGETSCNIFENKIEWHYRHVDEKTYKLALALLSKEKM